MDIYEFLINFYSALHLIGVNEINKEDLTKFLELARIDIIITFPNVELSEFDDINKSLLAINIIRKRLFSNTKYSNNITTKTAVKLLKMCNEIYLTKILSLAFIYREFLKEHEYNNSVLIKDREASKECSEVIKLVKYKEVN